MHTSTCVYILIECINTKAEATAVRCAFAQSKQKEMGKLEFENQKPKTKTVKTMKSMVELHNAD